MEYTTFPTEIYTLIAEQLVDDLITLKSFSLVSKLFRNASIKIIWSSIEILENRGGSSEVLELVRSERRLGGWVKKLTNKYYLSKDQLQLVDPSYSNPEDFLSVFQHLVEIGSLFHLITSLNFTCPLITQPEIIPKFNSNFSFLTKLNYEAAGDRNLILFRELLLVLPHISTLQLYNASTDHEDGFETIEKCPIHLKHLHLRYFQHSIFNHHQPIFKLESLDKLETLQLDSYEDQEYSNIQGLLEVCSSTLKRFSYNSAVNLNFDDIEDALPNLLLLESITTSDIYDLPEFFLSLVPITMRHLKIPVNKIQLRHLEANPRDDLNLIELAVETWQDCAVEEIDGSRSNLDLLPSSIEVLYLTSEDGCMFDNLLDLAFVILKYRKNLVLKKVVTDVFSDYRLVIQQQTLRASLAFVFAKVGIELVEPIES